ncbi:MAG: type II toxin-antitoxin system VapC family toxin [Myxococcota bacterium]
MRTAVDSNVLLDVLKPDPAHRESSLAALEQAAVDGALVVGDVVWAEVGGRFESHEACARAFGAAGIEFVPTEATAAHVAGRAWLDYRRRGGKRERMLADFLVGAHALRHADRLLTRDRGYYRTYFPRLRIWQPG